MPSFLGLEYVHPAQVEGVRPESNNIAVSGRISSLRFGHVRWKVGLTFEPRISARTIDARLAVHKAKQGTTGSFSIPMPQIVDGELPGDAGLVVAATSVGASGVQLKASSDTVLSIGRFISFAGHDKVYQVDGADDYTVVSSGTTVTVVPNLLAGVVGGARWFPNPSLLCRYASSARGGWASDGRGIVRPTVSLLEV